MAEKLIDIEFLLFKFRLVGKILQFVIKGMNARVGMWSILFGDFCFEFNHEYQS